MPYSDWTEVDVLSQKDVGRLITARVPPEVILFPYSLCQNQLWALGLDTSPGSVREGGYDDGCAMKDIREAIESVVDGTPTPCAPTLVLLDEIHLAKNETSKVHGYWRLAPACPTIGLSGTMAPNRLRDLQGILKACKAFKLAKALRPSIRMIEQTDAHTSHGRKEQREAMARTTRLLAGRLLAMTKEQYTAALMPAKSDKIIQMAMQPFQQRVYDRVQRLPEMRAAVEGEELLLDSRLQPPAGTALSEAETKLYRDGPLARMSLRDLYFPSSNPRPTQKPLLRLLQILGDAAMHPDLLLAPA